MRPIICLSVSISTIFLSTAGQHRSSSQEEKEQAMIILTVLRAIGAFFASLPGSIAEAQKLRREYYKRHPFMEF
jgi:hypothetical protein